MQYEINIINFKCYCGGRLCVQSLLKFTAMWLCMCGDMCSKNEKTRV